MNKLATAPLVVVLVPALAMAEELKGTVLKVDKVKNQLVVKTEKGQEKLEITKSTKGIEQAKQGAKVTV